MSIEVPSVRVLPGPPGSPVAPARDAALATLVPAAAAGDERAWEALVARFDPLLRRIARSHRLAPADAEDAVQATWLLALRHLRALREPAALPGWLSTTARRECLRLLQRHVSEEPTDDPALGDGGAWAAGPEERLVAEEEALAVRRALDALPQRHRRLLLALVSDEGPDYQRAGRALAMPVGSIGPTRRRSLERLRRDRRLRAVVEGA